MKHWSEGDFVRDWSVQSEKYRSDIGGWLTIEDWAPKNLHPEESESVLKRGVEIQPQMIN